MLLLIDESVRDTTAKRCCYVIAAGLLLSADVERTRSAAWHAVAGRKRPFHWTDEGPTVRAKMLQVVARHAAGVVVAIAADVAARHQEHARQQLLRQVFEAVQECDVSTVLIESRERSGRNEGQNHRDYSTLVDARHAQVLARQVRYDWVDKADPLIWLPDAVAGAAGAEHTLGQTHWLADLRAARSLQVIGP